MTLAFLPEHGWQVWAAVLSIAATLAAVALFVRAVRRARAPLVMALGGRLRTQYLVVTLTAATALLLAVALCGPVLIRRPPARSFHVPVVVDVSDSVLRAPGGWPAIRAQIADRLREAFDGEQVLTSQVFAFRSSAAAIGSVIPLTRAADQVAALGEAAFGEGSGTDIAAGLARAGAAIDRTGGRGAIVLFSDGHETDGDARAAAAQLAGRGIVTHVVPLSGGPPEVGIVSANLPAYVDAGRETFVRGVLSNGSSEDARAALELARPILRTGAGPAGADVLRQRTDVGFAGGEWGRFRMATTFEQPGLQYVDVSLRTAGNLHRRRLFTNVERPPRILVIGDDQWTRAFPPGAILAVRRDPRQLTAKDAFDTFEGFVLDSVPKDAFADGVLTAIAATVKSRGAGLFVANGSHLRSPRDATNLMTYNGTPLEELLPLVSKPRPKDEQAPPRHVVMVIDTSSSMCGGPLEQAQQIAIYMVEHVLRSSDRLDLLTFTTGASQPLTGVGMTSDGKAMAIDEIRRLTCFGGTDPRLVLQILSARSLSNCALLFFSDGEFGALPAQRPDCRTTAFGIAAQDFGPGAAIRALADPIHVPPGFDPTRIKIPSLEPRPVDQFYEVGAYRPLSMKFVLPSAAGFTVPTLDLDGSATTFAKPEADLIAVRPKLADPVLAYRQSGAAVVGAFVTTFPPSWLAREEGREAIQQWIAGTFPLIDSRRYVFEVTQTGSDVDVEVSLSPIAGRLPRVDAIAAHLELAGGTTSLSLRRDDVAPATFRGRFTIPANESGAEGTIVLQESGAEAIPRAQRVPMLIPPRDTVDGQRRPESFSAGLNEPLLRAIASAGGGTYDEPRIGSGGIADTQTGRWPLWPPLVVIAAACLLGAVFFRRVDP